MTQASGSSLRVANHQVGFVVTGNKHHRLLISRLPLLCLAEFFRCGSCADRIFEETHAPTAKINYASGYIHGRDLNSAAVVERKLRVVGLHSNRCDYPGVIKLEKAETCFEAKRIVFYF